MQSLLQSFSKNNKPKQVNGTLCGQCEKNIDIDTCLFTTKCDHKFHIHCCYSWFKSNDHCPICNQNVISTDIRWRCTEFVNDKSKTFLEYLFSNDVCVNVHKMLLLSKEESKNKNIFTIMFCTLFFLNHKLEKFEIERGQEALNILHKYIRLGYILSKLLSIVTSSRSIVDKIIFFISLISYDIFMRQSRFVFGIFSSNYQDPRFYLMFVNTVILSLFFYAIPLHFQYDNKSTTYYVSFEWGLFLIFMIRMFSLLKFYYECLIFYYGDIIKQFLNLIDKKDSTGSTFENLSNILPMYLSSINQISTTPTAPTAAPVTYIEKFDIVELKLKTAISYSAIDYILKKLPDDYNVELLIQHLKFSLIKLITNSESYDRSLSIADLINKSDFSFLDELKSNEKDSDDSIIIENHEEKNDLLNSSRSKFLGVF